MGFYTHIYFLPENAPDWQPDESFLQSLFEKTGISSVYIFVGSSVPATWESELLDFDDSEEAPEVFNEMRVPISEVINRWTSMRPLVARMICSTSPWSKRVIDYLWPIVPADIRGECHPWDTSIVIGPWSTCDDNCERTIAYGNFYLSLACDRAPLNNDLYLKYFQECPDVVDMHLWLEQQTGMKWKKVLSVS